MEATLTLHQAGNQLGVEDTVLSRLIRIGALPEARKIHRPGGDVWVIPADKLPSVANRNGWTIDLREGAEDVVIEQSPSDDDKEDSEPAAQTDDGDAPASALGALVPHADALVTHGDTSSGADGGALEVSEATPATPSVAEAIDLALLDRLLGVQEERVTAQVEARETRHALAALNTTHDRTTGELEIERRERMVTADRYREERMARAVADAKIAELRDRVVREMTLADAEKQARSEALTRSIRAEREAANALASMGWFARRRYRRLSDSAE